MEQEYSNNPLLELLAQPAFCVKDRRIIQANEAARQRSVNVGEPLDKYLLDNPEVYDQFTGGCLFLTIHILDLAYSTAVTRMVGFDLFVMENITDIAKQALALAAQQLRQPLNTVFCIADDMTNRKQAEQLTQGLNQIHRMICNMADLGRYTNGSAYLSEATDISAVFDETIEKAQTLLAKAGFKLHYTALPEMVVGMADREMLERAIYNLLSNAAKYSPKGSPLEARLVRNGKLLCFTLRDHGEGIPPNILEQAFFRFLREPTIEDSRHGLGIGLALVASTAACHKGTVLIDQPEDGGTRITMTLTITPCTDNTLHSPVRTPLVDYSSGHDHGLLEFSEILPAKAYRS